MDYQSTLNYFVNKFGLNLSHNSPINIQSINRPIMGQCLSELGFNCGAEIGVAAGHHSELLLKSIPNLTLYSVDPWSNSNGYRAHKSSTLEEWRKLAVENLSKYSGSHIIRKQSMDAVNDFGDFSLDFVYLDGGHDFKNIAMDISEWIKKVKHGGILYGHDYTRITIGRYCCHVQDVVDAYAISHAIIPWFSLGLDGKVDGCPYREGQQSWMYICI